MSATPKPPVCMAGRQATYGGRWQTPCDAYGLHHIATNTPGLGVILCDAHFQQALVAGLVTRPYVGLGFILSAE